MKLIDEKEVEQAAKNHSIFENSQRYDCVKLDSFIEGVEFSEQKLISLIVEFVEWANLKYYKIGEVWILRGGKWINYSTEQLLEQFIKTKQDEKEKE